MKLYIIYNLDETRPCIWYKIYERSFALGCEGLLLEVLPPLDWGKVGTDSWRDIFRQVAKNGVRNILCITGDSARLSPSPREKMGINDLDAIQMLWILRRMRDEGKYLDGREMKTPPTFFLGAAASPFA